MTSVGRYAVKAAGTTNVKKLRTATCSTLAGYADTYDEP